MSFKEDINAIKTEIDNEEKVMTAFVKVEKFFSKYKKPFAALAISIVAGFAGYIGYGYYKDHKIQSANEAYVRLQKNPNDKEAEAALKSDSPALYEAYAFKNAIKNRDAKALEGFVSSKNRVIADMATYEASLLSADMHKLSSYAANKEGVYRDMALFVLADRYIQKSEYQKAKESLNKIAATSQMKEFADYLYHSIATYK